MMWVCNDNNYRVSEFIHKLTKYELSNFPFVLLYNCIDDMNSELLCELIKHAFLEYLLLLLHDHMHMIIWITHQNISK